MLERLARFSFRHRGAVLITWVIVLGCAITAVMVAGGQFSLNLGLAGSDSQRAANLVTDRFPEQAGASANILIKTADIHEPGVQQSVQTMTSRLRSVNQVRSAVSPYEAAGTGQQSPGGQVEYILVRFNVSADKVEKQTTKAIQAVVASGRTSEMQVEAAGEPFALTQGHGTSEGIGLLGAALILLIAFGSLAAMGMPIATALFSVATAGCLVTLLSHVIPMPEAATRLVAMIGIGVGIDYALLIVTRYRQELFRHPDPEAAAVRAIGTAGRSVLLAGTTVAVSLLSLVLMNIGIVQALGIAATTVVVLAMTASMTLVPALLGYFGSSLRPIALKSSRAKWQGMWYTWATFVERQAWPLLIGGVAVIAVLSLPAFSLRLGSSDASGRSPGDPLHRAYDLQTEGFGAGTNGPIIVAADMPQPADLWLIQQAQAQTALDPNVAAAGPVITTASGTAAMFAVIPRTSPQDQRTVDLVSRLRTNILPQAVAGSETQVYVGGVTASFTDLGTAVGQRMPYFIGVVLLLCFSMLLVLFRSLVIPLKAVLLNLLSVTAAYGVLVAVFQWGWFKEWLGLGVPGPIESFLPVMLFAVLFGLSMDYEVFLLTRIKEYYDQTGDNNRAIAEGLAATARVITAAAAIMIVVFASFLLGNDRVIKEFGLGLAAAVLIDATIVRLILVPATMTLFGRANWWLPGRGSFRRR